MHDPAFAPASPNALSLICALLRGEAPAWPVPASDGSIEDFLRAARCHGMTPLLDAIFTEGDWREPWPDAIRRACRVDALGQAIREVVQRTELARVLAALAQAGIGSLILKGTGLAYSHYPRPELRPRGDSDLLIPPDSAATAGGVLQGLGYAKSLGVEGEQVSHQATWSRTGEGRVAHHFDVHWRISDSPILARTLDYEELARSARPVPALGPHARTPAPVEALLFACMHRAGHSNAEYRCGDLSLVGGDRLIWLYDVHLLCGAMSPAETGEFARLAAAKQLRTICLDALHRTRERFGTPIAEDVFDAMQPGSTPEPSASLLHGGQGRRMLGDFLALDGWPARLQWMKETGFPAADYMRGKYPEAKIRWLPALYARRALAGLGKLIAPRDSGRRS